MDNVVEESTTQSAPSADWAALYKKFLAFFPEEMQGPQLLTPVPVGPPSITPAFDALRENKAPEVKLDDQNATVNAPAKPQA